MTEMKEKTTGITDAQLARLRGGGWVDDDDEETDFPAWLRWVGEAKVGDFWEAQGVWLYEYDGIETGPWNANAGLEASGGANCDTLDEALDRCDEWKGGLKVAPAPAGLTNQAERFAAEA